MYANSQENHLTPKYAHFSLVMHMKTYKPMPNASVNKICIIYFNQKQVLLFSAWVILFLCSSLYEFCPAIQFHFTELPLTHFFGT